MTTKKRVRRPEPDRTGPIRNWSALFGAPPARAPEDEGAAEARPTSLGEAVSRSVELGYRVVDEYVRQGQRAAQRLNDRSLGPETIARDVQDLTARMAQYASDFMGVWFEFLELASAGSNARAQDGQAPRAESVPHPPRPRREAPPARTRARLEVVSAMATEVSLDLDSDASGRTLVVHALRAVDPDTPRLVDVVLEPGTGGEPPTLRLRVPADQPPGVYNGLVVDQQTNRPAGTVSVRLGPRG